MTKQLSISIEKIGLKKYLQDTKDSHNNQGYEEFIFYINPKLKIGQTAIGRLMNVHRNTIRRWVEVYEKEKKNGKR